MVSKSEYQGYLLKKGNNVIKDWKRRWVVIKSGSLYYYEDETSPQPLGVLSLLLSTVKRNKARDTFEMILPNRIYYFKSIGKGTNEMSEWMEAIRKASEKTYSELGTDKRLLRESGTKDLAASSPASPLSLSASRPADSPSPLAEPVLPPAEANKQMLNQIIDSDPHNQVCVDCSDPSPRWASINLGIFFCIECSGIHRSLGVHISQVRSVDLDTWDAETVEFMRVVGNRNSNHIFEHQLAPGAKAEPRSARETKELWIFAKYVELKYADLSQLPQEFLDLRKSDRPQTVTTTQQAGHKKFFKCGWMQKCGGSVKTWKRRWFVLKITASSGNLFYYRNKQDPSPAGYINIAGATTRVATAGGRDFAFEIVTAERIYQIVADNSSDMSAWMTTLREAAEYLNQSSFPSFYLASSPDPSPAGHPQQPQRTQSRPPPGLSSSQSRILKKKAKLTGLLQEKFSRDHNMSRSVILSPPGLQSPADPEQLPLSASRSFSASPLHQSASPLRRNVPAAPAEPPVASPLRPSLSNSALSPSSPIHASSPPSPSPLPAPLSPSSSFSSSSSSPVPSSPPDSSAPPPRPGRRAPPFTPERSSSSTIQGRTPSPHSSMEYHRPLPPAPGA